MKTVTLSLLFSLAAFAQTKPPVVPAPAKPDPVHTMTDKQRGDFWLASYKSVQAELALAKTRIEADEKLLLDPAAKERDKAGQSIVQTCPEAKLDPSGDIACPAPVPEATKPVPEVKPAK